MVTGTTGETDANDEHTARDLRDELVAWVSLISWSDYRAADNAAPKILHEALFLDTAVEHLAAMLSEEGAAKLEQPGDHVWGRIIDRLEG